jgi:hypothetical protein
VPGLAKNGKIKVAKHVLHTTTRVYLRLHVCVLWFV